MKKLMLIAFGLTGLLLASCESHKELANPNDIHNQSDLLIANFSVEDQGKGMTRATVDPTLGEEDVHEIYLLFFDPSTDRSGEFKGAIKVDGPVMMNEDIRVDMSGNSDLHATEAYKVLAVTNVEQYAPYLGLPVNQWLSSLEGLTENNVYKQILAYVQAGQQIDRDNIIMTGEAEKPAGGLSTIRLILSRGLVRFDVVNSARESYDLVEVSIWNTFPEMSMFGGGLVDYSKNRIQRFYGITNEEGTDGDANGLFYKDIFGGLYTTPNQVINPKEKDDKTTCLIIGLRERGESQITYHRVNINAEDAMQNLKRNNAYRITIRSVSGDGAGSEMEAYTGGVNNINCKINYWDLDDDGLIQQNGNIVLGIPTKRIKMGAEAEERSYDIFAFGGAPGEQIIVTTSFAGNAGNFIKVTQSGNTITVNAEALSIDEERTGTITITYGGLTATIGIIQTGTLSKFLRVTTPTGSGIPSYPGFAGAAMDGVVSVEASGPWTATLYQMGSEKYFSFNQLTDDDVYASSLLTGELKIYTIAENNTPASRQAFVLITLDGDEDNHNSALVLTQRAMGSIALSPSIAQVDWDGLGKLQTTGGGSSDTEFRFQVVVSKNDLNEFEEWETVLEGDSYFEIVASKTNFDKDVLANNYVTVKAKGETQDGTQMGKLRVQLKSSPTKGSEVVLKQTGYTLGLSPNTASPVSNKGGETGEIKVTTNGTGLTWSAKVVSVEAAKGTLIRDHKAIVVRSDNGNAVADDEKLPTTQGFKVKYPKLLYGNHQKGDVTSKIEIILWSGNNEVGKDYIEVVQNELTPKNVNIANYHGSGANFGNLYSNGDHYTAGWRRFLTNLFSPSSANEAPAYPDVPATPFKTMKSNNVILLPGSQATAAPVASNVTYVHASRASRIADAGAAADHQGAIENWRAADNGILFVGQQHTEYSRMMFWPLRKFNITSAGTADNANARGIRYGSDKKIRDFIFNKGPFGPVGNDYSMNSSTSANWYIDGYSLSINITACPTAVALMGNDNRAAIMIDPTNRIVFIGDDQMWGRGATSIATADNMDINLGNDKSRMLANIMAYIVLTAQYGSNFSDLFID